MVAAADYFIFLATVCAVVISFVCYYHFDDINA
jgi:hypothetical protein